MNAEERDVVIRFLFIPSYPANLFLKEEEAEYFTEDTAKEVLEELKHMNLCNDALFKIVMENSPEAVEYLARGITGEEMSIIRVLTQYEIKNLGHSVIMDVLAEDSEGRFIDFEMQNSVESDQAERMRMYESSFNIAFLAKGAEYSRLPALTSIWLIAGDRHGKGRSVHTSYLKDQDNQITDWTYARYEVNVSYEGDDEIGRIMYNMRCREYDEMNDDPLKKGVGFVKNTKEGQMAFESDFARWEKRGLEKGVEKGRDDAIGIVLKSGMATPEDVAKNFGLSLSEVYEIAKRTDSCI